MTDVLSSEYIKKYKLAERKESVILSADDSSNKWLDDNEISKYADEFAGFNTTNTTLLRTNQLIDCSFNSIRSGTKRLFSLKRGSSMYILLSKFKNIDGAGIFSLVDSHLIVHNTEFD
jgi:hypothetical protein